MRNIPKFKSAVPKYFLSHNCSHPPYGVKIRRKRVSKRARWITALWVPPMARIGSVARSGRIAKSYVWVCPDSASVVAGASMWRGVVAYKWLLTSWKKKNWQLFSMLYIKFPTTGLNFTPFGVKFKYTGVNLWNFVLTGTSDRPVPASGGSFKLGNAKI